MKIGIISDSHDNLPALKKAVSLFNDIEADLVIHAGDFISPFVSLPLNELEMDFIGVFGNNDGDKLNLQKALKNRIFRSPHIIEVEGKRIAIMHEPDYLESLEKSGDFSAIIYGHTHEVDIRGDRTLIINPGECGGWINGERTIALWDTITNDVNILRV
ncbi:metallophosphoesterase [bacterium]|nr:metallophosphoesterase [bacterium]